MPPRCSGPPEETQTTNQPHQECMNLYLVSISSLTIKNTSTEIPPNQENNQLFMSTDSIKKYPHPPNMRSSKANPHQISTKLCNHNQRHISSSHSSPTTQKIFPYPRRQKLCADGNERKNHTLKSQSNLNVTGTKITIVQSPLPK